MRVIKGGLPAVVKYVPYVPRVSLEDARPDGSRSEWGQGVTREDGAIYVGLL